MTPADVVNAQLLAYNNRDIEAFAATYADDVCVYEMPHARLRIRGKAQLIEHYGSKPFAHEGLRAEILSRSVIGNKVIDLEKTWGLRPEPIEVMVVYEVGDGLIKAVWFFDPAQVSGAPDEA